MGKTLCLIRPVKKRQKGRMVKYQTRIISYEEHPDRDGRLFTVYNIQVQVFPLEAALSPTTQLTSTSSSSSSPSQTILKSWFLHKRYKYVLLFLPLPSFSLACSLALDILVISIVPSKIVMSSLDNINSQTKVFFIHFLNLQKIEDVLVLKNF
jgi:hypothetical protein